MMTAYQLKMSILRLAMRGQLVDSIGDKSSTKAFLESIDKEKQSLISRGSVKQNKNDSYVFCGEDGQLYEKIGKKRKCIQEEIPFEIPPHWEWRRLSSISYNYDSARRPVSVGDREKLDKKYDYYGATGAIDKVDKYLFDGTFVLTGEDGGNFYTERDNAFIVKGQFWANNHVHVLRVISGFEKYFCYFLNSLDLASMGLINGIAVPKLNQAHLNSILVPIPPLEEQKCIVAKIEELMPFVEQYAAASTKLDTLTTSFPEMMKKSILQEAVQGKLVPQDPNDEPASELLKKDQKKKREEGRRSDVKKKDVKGIHRTDNGDYCEKNDGNYYSIKDKIPFEIPESWEWIHLGYVCDIARGGSPRPIKSFLTDDPNGINWIKIGDSDIGGKYINQTKERIIPEGVKKSRFVQAGDFLLTNSMSFGRPYILNCDGCIHDGWLVLTGYKNVFDMDFLYYMLSSGFAFSQFCDVVSGGVVKNLNSDKVADALFPVPPLEEQKRIVAKIEELLPICERQESIL